MIVAAFALVLAGCGSAQRDPGDQPTVGTPPPVATPKPSPTPKSAAEQLKASLRLLRGIPQNGLTLGRPKARVTLTVYASIDAFSDRFFGADLPQLVRRWVRPGRLKLQLVTGGRSPAAAAVQAAALQHRGWQLWAATSARYDGGLDAQDLRIAARDAQLERLKHPQRRKVRRLTAAAAAKAPDDLPAYTVSVDGSAPQALNACNGLCLVPAVGTVMSS